MTAEPIADPRFALRHLARHLGRYTYRQSDEQQLQCAIEAVLQDGDFNYEREVTQGGDRFDFLVAGRIVIEVKVDGSLTAALRQISRYLANENVDAVLIASTKRWSLGEQAEQQVQLHGKPVELVRCRSRAF